VDFLGVVDPQPIGVWGVAMASPPSLSASNVMPLSRLAALIHLRDLIAFLSEDLIMPVMSWRSQC